jgi:hypothetical protein
LGTLGTNLLASRDYEAFDKLQHKPSEVRSPITPFVYVEEVSHCRQRHLGKSA